MASFQLLNQLSQLRVLTLVLASAELSQIAEVFAKENKRILKIETNIFPSLV